MLERIHWAVLRSPKKFLVGYFGAARKIGWSLQQTIHSRQNTGMQQGPKISRRFEQDAKSGASAVITSPVDLLEYQHVLTMCRFFFSNL